MAFINIFVETDSNISVKNNQLVLSAQNSENFPLSDINSVLIDNQKINISVYTLSKLIENNIAVYICNEKHMPVGYILSNSYYSNIKMYQMQTKAKKPLLKQIWKKIIEIKIKNQSEVLKIVGKNYQYLDDLTQNLLSGDKNNQEAVAANYYFKELFGADFKRRDENQIANSCLNYGYAIIRGIIARTVTAHGLLPFLGIEHKSFLNNFNLVDDLIEVFRPIVDLFVYENIDFKEEKLTPQIKHSLFNLQNYDVIINNNRMTIYHSIELYVNTYISAIEKNDINLIKFPTIIPLKVHNYE